MNARFVVIIVGLSIAVPLRAQAMGEAPQASEKGAREHAGRAQAAFNLGRFSDALIEYEAAYEAKPMPGFLFNIAQCHRNLKNYEQARFFYGRYLALDPGSEDRASIEGLIAEMTRNMDQESSRRRPDSPDQSSTQPPSVAALGGGLRAPSALPVLQRSEGSGQASSTHASDVANGPEGRPVYHRWWFWTSVGVALAGAITAGIVVSREPQARDTLPPIDARPGH
jgi:tetratricopeptide (TPR) repeat protein